MIPRITLGAGLVAVLSSLVIAGPSHATVFVSDHAPGYCLDINMSTKQAALWNCHGGSNQNFAFAGYGAVKVGAECLDTQAAPEGKALILAACRNAPGQKWGYDASARQFKNEQGWCADIHSGRRDRGAPIIAWKCGPGGNQKWSQGRVLPIAQAHSLGLNASQVKQLQAADLTINRAGGNVIGQNGANVVGNNSGGVIGQNGANILATGNGNLVSVGR